jgi:hypothetical protein
VERHGTSCVVLLDESLDSPDHKLADLVFSQLVLEKTLIFVSLKGKSWVFEKQESPSVPQ